MKKVAFHTLGCKVNQYETGAMEKLFEDRDYSIVSDTEVADIYIINTCTVTNLSDRKSRQFIRRVKKLNEEAIIAVVGCYAQVSPEEIEDLPFVDVIMGTTERNRVVDLCEMAKQENKKFNIVKDISTNTEFEKLEIDNINSKTRAYIKIQDGCNQYCSYCIIPYARGPIRSRDLEDIIEEAKTLSEAGFKELVLTGIHVASYGKDLKDLALIDVIEKISQIDGIERIRLSSVEPNLIDKEFMERIVKTKKVCDHFHLSLQSGSNTVLKRMNRKYTSEEFEEKTSLIRKFMPYAGLTTDIIVGFPEETEEEFNETLEFVKKIGFSKIHVFKYSPRKGTPAARSKTQINGIIKNERSKSLIELGEKLTEKFNSKFIGQSLEVLFEESSQENILEGYTTNYIRAKVHSDYDIIGDIKKINIVDTDGEILVGN
ncbi:tRNA (N(6)-L-threonylcarbamoyladenosine(37)-C(2))-methylthiotransferase MtaB [Tissierella creatinophila]|uniref:Threonylcarbamoyladenosine tRNA methylthiotransferase MtaB n=1 Tax=Tissierella creatinophila DSM 6911 TaxID=1123403 RepID=A0A1U7M7T6_TISCR|nr:tRNA (N(6)-L-threonylcarbamoyladenosine(37)-C(2))-methylthiotransferase MtaB [Tissierella creatinophila]OLS03383.1 threonylcarbamoyladenosine tRNA methylthiotransferase MtaB [Tissierella creatinophila DSM 6911]